MQAVRLFYYSNDIAALCFKNNLLNGLCVRDTLECKKQSCSPGKMISALTTVLFNDRTNAIQRNINNKVRTLKAKAVLLPMKEPKDAKRFSGTKGKVLFIESNLVALR